MTGEAAEGFDQLPDAIHRSRSVAESQHDPDESFVARFSRRAFGVLTLTDATARLDAKRFVRGPAEIRKDLHNHFMLFYMIEGEICVDQDGRAARARPGDLVLYDQSRPLTLAFHPRFRAIMSRIPRPLMESRIPRTRDFTARRIPGDSKIGALAGSIIRQLIEFDECTDTSIIDRVGASALDIVATAITSLTAGDVLPNSARHRLLTKVETYLLANLHDSRLDIAAISIAVHMAPRTLSRIFAAEHTTPMRWLWQQRLAASYREIAEGRAESVTDTALSFGFSDVSHFSHAFKIAFGESPHALQRRRDGIRLISAKEVTKSIR